MVKKQSDYPIVGGKITGKGIEFGQSDPHDVLEHVVASGSFPYGGVGGFSEEFPPKRRNAREILPEPHGEIPVGRPRR